MILVSDLGGTNARLALFDDGVLRVEKTYPTREHAGLGAVVRLFLREHPAKVEAACFGVPGPVCGESVALPNLPWVVDRAELVEASGTGRVRLANDLECAARGLPLLRAEETATLRAALEAGPSASRTAREERGVRAALEAGPSASRTAREERGVRAALEAGPSASRTAREEPGVRAVVAAGTGLGEAVLVPAGEGWLALASEGGHTDFGPLDELQMEFLRWLWKEHPRPTYELILSGPGLTRLHRFLRSRPGAAESEEEPSRDAYDAGAVIVELGTSGRSALCRRALEIFAQVYVAEAANVAVQYLAVGGVFLCGGLAPRILPFLRDAAHGFTAKVKMREFLQGVPLRVVLDGRLGLLGAAELAREAR